ncbi:hypothetical protein ACI65C_002722 [Semiaphis heraclei]
MNVVGVISIVFFYCLILSVGLWAGKKKHTGNSEEEVMLAGRNIGLFVGIFTMTATWVGGGYINGTAEAIYTSGLLWCQAPFGYALSLVFGGIFFADPMRRQGYVTMLDPLQDCFGERMGGLLFLPALCGEVFWSAGILSALGATLSVIIELDQATSVILSCCIAVFYTIFGGLASVAYTDVIQLFAIFIGLWLSVPFAWYNKKVDFNQPGLDLIGEIQGKDFLSYVDYALLLVFGGIPWQVYFQRVLSSKSAAQAQILSFVAAFGCFIMAIPPVIIGMVARATDWNQTKYDGPMPMTQKETSMVLPMVMQYLTPDWVAFFALGAISAAIMSSADSSVLSASSMFARNIYRMLLRQSASEMEIVWVMRLSIVVVAFSATTMAITIPSIYGLWSMCSDLVYVILFPQLTMVVHFKHYCNTYGSLAAYIVAFYIRMAGGEPLLGLRPMIHFPGWDGEKQLFPFRTTAMLCSLFTLVFVSWFTKWLFINGKLAPHYDWFHCVVNIPEDAVRVGEPHEGEQMTTLTSGPMGAKYGAAVTTGLVGKDERNGRINPALDINDDVASTTTAAVQRKASVVGKVYKQGYEQTTTGF